MKRLNVRQVEAFQAVMLLGNMTRAAELLEISQPAVSRLMADLQDAVGFKLFRRTRHGTVPTADAHRLLVEVKNVFAGLDELSRRAAAIRSLELGELRIGAVSIYGNGELPQIATDFARLHPGLSVELQIDVHDRIVERVAAGTCDVGIVSMPGYSGDLTVVRLAARPALCVLPATHRLAAKTIIHAQDLAGESFVSFPRDVSSRVQIDEIFNSLGVRRDLKFTAGTHESACNLVAANAGISIVNPFSPHLKSDPAVVFRPFEPPWMREIGMLIDEDRLTITGQAFKAHAIDYFRAHYAAETPVRGRTGAARRRAPKP